MEEIYYPYARQHITNGDKNSVARVLDSDFLTQGPEIEAFENGFTQATGADYAVACNSGTAALHLAYRALGLAPGDQIIIPSLSFAATANAAVFCGAEVIFADVCPMTGLVGIKDIINAYDKADISKIKAITIVHLNGQICDMKPIAEFAKAHDLWLIEDACHALGGFYDTGDQVGSCHYSDAACFSFHGAKIITCGEGGMITCPQESLAQEMKRLRSHGIERQNLTHKFILADAPPWYHEFSDLFMNYRLSDIAAALGHSQVQRLPKLVQKRAELVAYYRKKLINHPYFTPLHQHEIGQAAWHLMVISLHDDLLPYKNRLFQILHDLKIGVQVHYIPIDQQPYYQRICGKPATTNADHYYRHHLTIPLYTSLNYADIDEIIARLDRSITISLAENQA